jgi:Na+-transporting methylmalonyl-CoA/oxaloacetate decarboxylase gamma subunit
MNMLVTLLFTWPNVTGMPIGERVAYALRMLIVGLGAVFAILALLWGILVLARILLHDMPARRKDKSSNVTVVAEPATPAPAPAPAPAAQPVAQDNGALIAVITAAVSAAMAEEGTLPAGGFRVVSFRRASNTGAWNRK